MRCGAQGDLISGNFSKCTSNIINYVGLDVIQKLHLNTLFRLHFLENGLRPWWGCLRRGSSGAAGEGASIKILFTQEDLKQKTKKTPFLIFGQNQGVMK